VLITSVGSQCPVTVPYVSVLGTVFRRGRGSFISCGTQFLSSISTLALKKKTQRGTSAKSTEEISDLERGLRTQFPIAKDAAYAPLPDIPSISPQLHIYFTTNECSTAAIFSYAHVDTAASFRAFVCPEPAHDKYSPLLRAQPDRPRSRRAFDSHP